MQIKIPDYVRALQPYKPGNQKKKANLKANVKQIFSLASNENPLPTSVHVRDAIVKATAFLSEYPDPVSTELVEVLAGKFNKKPEQIVCAHGSESLIAHIVSAFSDIDTRILTSEGTFAGIYVNTHKIGRKLNLVSLENYRYDLEGILNRINKETRIIYISNPNNPTGSMVTKDEFDYFIERVPENIVVVLDEAYSIYAAEHEGYVEGAEYDDIPNLIVLQTLSKTHGLAGLRIGYAMGPKPLIDTLYKVKYPFEPSLIAQKAAVAALKDDSFITETLRLNDISLKMMMFAFDRIGIKYVKPNANFILAVLPGKSFVEKFVAESLNYGIAIRNCGPFGLPDCVRISSGTEEQTEYAIDVFEYAYTKLLNEEDNSDFNISSNYSNTPAMIK